MRLSNSIGTEDFNLIYKHSNNRDANVCNYNITCMEKKHKKSCIILLKVLIYHQAHIYSSFVSLLCDRDDIGTDYKTGTLLSLENQFQCH